MVEKVAKGSIIDYVIEVDTWGGVASEYFDFHIYFFTPDNHGITIDKKELTKEDNYYTYSLDTSLLGVGTIKAKIHATMTNPEREEIIIVQTGIKIIDYELSHCEDLQKS